MNRTLSTSAVAASLVAAPLTGCSEPMPPRETPVVRQVITVLDVSGSTRELSQTFPHRVRTMLDAGPATLDGTSLTVVVADGSSPGTVCTPRTVQLVSEGDSPTKRKDSLARATDQAIQLVGAQINCGLKRNTPGSDLIGSLYMANGDVRPGLDSTRVLLFSDGVQFSETFKFNQKFLTNGKAQQVKLKQLADEGLLPLGLQGACLTVSDPAYGTAGMSPAAQAGISRFWTAYSQRIGARYLPTVSMTCDG